MNKPTTYPGLDYSGPGSSVNRNTDTNIRYGVISQHSVDCEVSDCIWQDGRNLSQESYMDEVKAGLRNALSDYFHDYKHGGKSKLDEAVESAFDAIEQDLNDGYQSDNDKMFYEGDGYKISTCLDSDLCVELSPYYTYAQFCSPCVPSACNLDSPLDVGAVTPPYESELGIGSNKCYCLGHDWFEKELAPYPVYSVATGKLVVSEETKVECPNCQGSGFDTLSRLADVRKCDLNALHDQIKDGTLKLDEFNPANNRFKCFRCAGAGHAVEMVQRELK